MSKKRGANSPSGKNENEQKETNSKHGQNSRAVTGGKKLSEKRSTDGSACEVGKRSRKKKKN